MKQRRKHYKNVITESNEKYPDPETEKERIPIFAEDTMREFRERRR